MSPINTTTIPEVDVSGMKEWRHAMHRHPELGFEEFETSALIERCLKQWGYRVENGIAGTGLVGVLEFKPGPARLGIRAEMDALPIQETTGLPWTSQIPGKMHACGHDGHTAMLLGAAKTLARMRDAGANWRGSINLIFQPAEELGGAGGAKRMIEEGLFERFPCDMVFAMHNHPTEEAGRLFFREGPYLASSDRVFITFRGKGGHGAMPHLAVDPTVVAAATVMALQTVVARNIDPLDSAVVTVGKLNTGLMYNIIPETAEMELSVRALNSEIRDRLEKRIHDIAKGQADAFNATCEIRYERGYPVLVNTAAETRRAARVARKLLGDSRVTEGATPLCASEDFAYMLQERPGCYLMIGNGDNGFGDGRNIGPCSVHNPGFDFNDQCLIIGASFWVSLAADFFSDAPPDLELIRK